MSGFGDSWQRWPRGDVERYPLLKQQMAQMLAAREAVGNYQPPRAIGDVRYVDDTELNAEIADFRTALEAKPIGFVEPFMTAPSPGIIAAAMKNEYYDSAEAYLAAVAAAIQVEYEAIVKSGFLLQLDCPDLALERHLTYDDRPVGQFLAFIERVVAAINKAIVNVPRDRCGSTSAGEITRGRTIATSRSPRSCRCSSRPMSAGSCCPSPIPGISMNIACCKNSRSPMIRSSPPASSMI
jgi:5-methyltetrahydropteroyltriglutamate--homocysteine methyltransferase